MKPISRLMLRFALIFVLCVIVLAAVWPRIAPFYAELTVLVSRPVFRVVEDPNLSIVQARGDEIWIYRQIAEGTVTPFTWFDRYTFFAVIPLISLLMATPNLGIRRRIARIACGLLVLLCIHVGYLVASVELSYAAIGLTPVGAFAARTLHGWQVFVRIFWEAAPVLVWLSLTARTWREALSNLRTDPSKRRAPSSVETAKAEG